MSASANTERRAFAAEVRASGRRLEGYVATFGAEARIGTFTESLAATAFDRTLADGRDKLAMVDHDPSRVLARTRSGTLRLSKDSRGLAFDLDVPDTQAGRDVLALAQRGDVGGMSFGFTVPRGGDAWDGDKRELRAVDLHEVSVVLAHPAYSNTSVNVRSAGARGSLRQRLAQLYMHSMRP
jgi:uncharacterized protein